MECRAVYQVGWWGTVKCISKQRVPERVGMDADLMCSAGGGDGFQQGAGCIQKALKHSKAGFGGFAFAVIHHRAVAVPNIYPQFVPGGVFIPFWVAATNGVVYFFVGV